MVFVWKKSSLQDQVFIRQSTSAAEKAIASEQVAICQVDGVGFYIVMVEFYIASSKQHLLKWVVWSFTQERKAR